jgi:hypothetical protein
MVKGYALTMPWTPVQVAAACQALTARLGSSASAEQQQQQQQSLLVDVLVTYLLRTALGLLKSEHACCISVTPLWSAASGLAMAALRTCRGTESRTAGTGLSRLDEICSFTAEAVASATQQLLRVELCELVSKAAGNKQQQLPRSP